MDVIFPYIIDSVTFEMMHIIEIGLQFFMLEDPF